VAGERDASSTGALELLSRFGNDATAVRRQRCSVELEEDQVSSWLDRTGHGLDRRIIGPLRKGSRGRDREQRYPNEQVSHTAPPLRSGLD
jgi:hypothetical protein